MIYSVFSPDGKFKLSLTSESPDAHSQLISANAGDYVVEVESVLTDVYYTPESGIVHIPASPTPFHVFNYATKQWEDQRTLNDHKDAKWAEIKAARTAAEHAGFTWDGSTLDSDAVSQQRITGAVTLATMSPAFQIEWVLADNTTRTLSQTDMIQVGAALGQHVAAQFAKGVSLRNQIEAATTIEEVQAIAWN